MNDLLDTCLSRLAEGAAVSWRKRKARASERWDARVVLGGAAGPVELGVLVKSRVRPSTVGALIAEVRAASADRGESAMICTEHVSQTVGNTLRAAGIAYADAAGNADVRAVGLVVHIQGNPALEAGAGDRRVPGGRGRSPLGRVAGLRLVHALLRDPGAVGGTVRELAAAAGLSISTVSEVLRELADEGWVLASGSRRRLSRASELHRRWVDEYLAVLRPALAPRRMSPLAGEPAGVLASRAAEWSRETAGAGGLRVGGPWAARWLGANLRSEELTLHLPASRRRAFTVALGLRADPAGIVTLLDAIGEELPTDERIPLADPLLVHAELLVVPDDRTIAAAETLAANWLAARWTQA